jgi:long-chain fatty acid transport protein
MKYKLAASCITAAVMGTATMSFGAGFKISEQGAKAMGMANAFAAQADDPSALAFNPAGIAFQKGTQVQVGSTTILVPQTEFTGTTNISGTTIVSEKAKRDIFIAPTFYAITSLESMPLSFGIGVNSFHPLAKSWDTGSAFRDSAQNFSLKPINFQPTAAYRFNDLNLAVAGGVDVTYAQASIQKNGYNTLGGLNPGGDIATVGVDGTAVGYGYNLGLLWKPVSSLSFGVAYRSKIKLSFEGDANYLALVDPAAIPNPTNSPTIDGLKASLPPKGTTLKSTVSADITLPDALTLGVAWKPNDQLTLEFDVERTGWSSFNSLAVNFGAPLTGNSNSEAKNWEDVWAYRIGAQYAVTPKFDLRAGYAYDKTPVPDSTLGPELPDADRHNFSIGTGMHNELGAIDLAYMWVHLVDRSVSNAKETGTFKSDIYMLAAAVTLKF